MIYDEKPQRGDSCPTSSAHFRFSLRTLLIATTLFALVLGIIVWMS
jgi:hypothetical protein